MLDRMMVNFELDPGETCRPCAIPDYLRREFRSCTPFIRHGERPIFGCAKCPRNRLISQVCQDLQQTEYRIARIVRCVGCQGLKLADAALVFAIDDALQSSNLRQAVGQKSGRYHGRPEHVLAREFAQVLCAVLLLPSIFLLDSLDGRTSVAVLKPPNVRRDLAEVGGFRLQVQSDDVQFIEALKSASRRAGVVVDHVAIELQLQVRPDDVFANIGQHSRSPLYVQKRLLMYTPGAILHQYFRRVAATNR